MTLPFVTILIPCKEVDAFTRECILRCKELEYERFEVLVLPDNQVDAEGVETIATGVVSPGRKRNVGASVARGEVFAYIDSDAYPRRDWLSNAVRHLQVDGVGAVGGPAVTPPGESAFGQAQGLALSSFLVGRNLASRYGESGVIKTDDIHSVNFVAWRCVIETAGGWNEDYWPGEDTLMSLKIRKAGYGQTLFPDVVVFHHRRRTWLGYLKQIRNYGLHRGYFAKRFPETSRRVGYFVPTALLLGLVCSVILSLVAPVLWWGLLSVIVAYFALSLEASKRDFHNALIVFVMISLTHLVYGVGFLQGLASRRLKR